MYTFAKLHANFRKRGEISSVTILPLKGTQLEYTMFVHRES